MTIVTQDSVANHIKPIFRALSPLILCGTAIGIYRLKPVFPVAGLHDDNTPFRIYGLPLMSYGWFELIWSLNGRWMKSLLFLLAAATIVLTLNRTILNAPS